MKVLIVDDEQDIASLLQDYLEFGGDHDISIAHSGAEALAKVYQQKPDLIILDILMPGLTGFQVLDAIKRNPQTSGIPIILSSITDGPPHSERKVLGIIGFLRKPIDFKQLDRLVRSLEKNRPKNKRALALLIDDNEEDIDLITTGLKEMGCSVIEALDGAEGLRLAKERNPDFVVLDYLLPINSGIDLVKELKSSPKTCHIPIILISAYIPSDSTEKLYFLREDAENTGLLTAEELCDKIKDLFQVQN